MEMSTLIPAVSVAAALAIGQIPATAQTALPAPHFHHLVLNSTNPDAVIDFYARQFANVSKTTWGGYPAVHVPTDMSDPFSAGMPANRSTTLHRKAGNNGVVSVSDSESVAAKTRRASSAGILRSAAGASLRSNTHQHRGGNKA